MTTPSTRHPYKQKLYGKFVVLNKKTQNVCYRHFTNCCEMSSCPTFKTNYAVFNLIKKLQKELTTQAYKLVQPNKTITDICDDFLRLWSLAKHSTVPYSFHGFPLFVHLSCSPQGKPVLKLVDSLQSHRLRTTQ